MGRTEVEVVMGARCVVPEADTTEHVLPLPVLRWTWLQGRGGDTKQGGNVLGVVSVS